MTKQKLFEYCQKNRISSPQFVTTGQGVIFSSAVVVQCLENAEDCQTFYSKESHTSKKKAENDAAEVALEVINAKIAQCTANSVGKESALSSIESFLQTVSKVVNSARPGIFDRQALVPAEFLILFSGIQSALNRIDPSFRKDALGAYSYLLNALYSPLQDFLRVEKNSNDEVFVSKISYNSIYGTTSWRSSIAQSKLSDTLKFILIPSSPNKKPYEISIDTTYERNESHTTNNQRDLADEKNDDADNERREGGSKCVKALLAVKKALNISGSVAISVPIFNSTMKNYSTGLSKIFCGEDIIEKIDDIACYDKNEIVDKNGAENTVKLSMNNNGAVEVNGIAWSITANPADSDICNDKISGIIDDNNAAIKNVEIINNNIGDSVVIHLNDNIKSNSEESSHAYFRPRLFIPFQESSQGKKNAKNRKEIEILFILSKLVICDFFSLN